MNIKKEEEKPEANLEEDMELLRVCCESVRVNNKDRYLK